MTRSPTAAVREQAAQLCSAMASQSSVAVSLVEETLFGELRFFTWKLAVRAFHQAMMLPRQHDGLGWALACSLLRNGEVR